MIGFLRAILAMDRRTGYRWYIGHIGTDLLAEALQTESGHKKPGLNERFGRDQLCPRPV